MICKGRTACRMPAHAQKPAGEDGKIYGGNLDLSTFQGKGDDAETCFGILPEKSRVCEVIGPER